MSSKLKALGLGVLAMLAVGAFAAMNAGATTGGHFVSSSPNGNTTITGVDETGEEQSELGIPGLTGIVCDNATYEGTVEGNTATEITITPKYGTCHTTGGSHNVTVDVNGCDYLFTIGKKATEHNTVHLQCEEGKKIEITHPNCTIRIPAQTVEGVVYKTFTTENGIHAITLESTVEGITNHFEAGFCILLGTTHAGTLDGSVEVEGYEDEGNDEAHPHGNEGPQVAITATGSED